MARYQAEGESRVRAPLEATPHLTDGDPDRDRGTDPPATQEGQQRGLDAGPDNRLAPDPAPSEHLSAATISRFLTRAGLIIPAPNKRPKPSYVRFQSGAPNEPGIRLHPLPAWPTPTPSPRASRSSAGSTTAPGSHSRSAHRRVTGPIVVTTFRTAAGQLGFPASTLTDNGMVFTTRLSGGQGGPTASSTSSAPARWSQKNSRPDHPTTRGKVERFQQTLKKWLRADPCSPPPSPTCRPSWTLRRGLQPPPPAPLPAA